MSDNKKMYVAITGFCVAVACMAIYPPCQIIWKGEVFLHRRYQFIWMMEEAYAVDVKSLVLQILVAAAVATAGYLIATKFPFDYERFASTSIGKDIAEDPIKCFLWLIIYVFHAFLTGMCSETETVYTSMILNLPFYVVGGLIALVYFSFFADLSRFPWYSRLNRAFATGFVIGLTMQILYFFAQIEMQKHGYQ
jgi:hypothetical protein